MISRSHHLALACLAVLAALGLLAGCWVPERYIARIKLERDGTYKAYAEGTAAHPEAYRAVRRLAAEAKGAKPEAGAKGAKPKPEDMKKLQTDALDPLLKDLEALKGDKRIMSVSSIGDGRVRFSVSGVWSIDRQAVVLSELQAPLSYGIGPDGSIRLRVKDAVPGREAKALGLNTEGDLSIVVAEGVEVLEHNAQRTPQTVQGAYRWHIDASSTQAPYLKVRLPGGQAQTQPQAQEAAAPGKHPDKGAHK